MTWESLDLLLDVKYEVEDREVLDARGEPSCQSVLVLYCTARKMHGIPYVPIASYAHPDDENVCNCSVQKSLLPPSSRTVTQ